MTLAQLLDSPDPPDLVGVLGRPRGHRIMIGGDHGQCDQIKLHLAIAYATWRWQEHDDVSCVMPARKMKIVRRA